MNFNYLGDKSSLNTSFDVLIIGAGISGINLAYHIHTKAPEPAPSSYAILESRSLDNFAGTIVHHQFWPEDLDYVDKDVVIIGSGATAVTLLPNLTEKAHHTTMLQRSPTYISPLPLVDKLAQVERAILPAILAGRVTRLRRAIRFFGFYWFCKFFPNTAKRLLRDLCMKLFPPNILVDPLSLLAMTPWTSGSVRVQMKVTEDEVILDSGTKLQPDIIVTATGLKLRIGGGIQFFVDGEPINIVDGFAWKGFMLQNVPNLAFVSGYYNAAWTLGAEVTGVAVVRLLRQMKSRGFSCVVPRLGRSDQNMEPQSFFKISSTYVKDAIKYTPKGGTGQWAHRWNYFFDLAKAS
ncbi:uncharacterized protein FRV6_14357 [Fusarium oxysporum]|uniref:Uncharacterized protein n=1 Tax=Fusarium oxysporum TaxID=5507 RepID=A0A2H3U894_FUSOX|nr:uncharacterized protein FRV6_14357 [Fusarium oxysporum]